MVLKLSIWKKLEKQFRVKGLQPTYLATAFFFVQLNHNTILIYF